MTRSKPWTVPSDGGLSSKWGEWLPLRPARQKAQALQLDLSNLTFVEPLFLVRLRALWAGNGRFSMSMIDGRQTMRRGWSTQEPTAGTWVRLELATKSRPRLVPPGRGGYF